MLAKLRDLQHEYQAMEFFGARSNRPIETCLEEIRRSDVVLVVLGFLYGSIVRGSELSYTQAEYEHANRLGKTCLVYVRDDDSIIPAKYMERDPTKMSRLRQFRYSLERRHTVVKFRHADDLAARVAADLSHIAEKKSTRPDLLSRPVPHKACPHGSTRTSTAALVQQQFLPSPLRNHTCDVAGILIPVPSEYVSGGSYDFFLYPDMSIALVLCDVAEGAFRRR